LAAAAHQAKRLAKAEGAGRHQRRVLAEAVAGRRHRPQLGGQLAERAVDGDRGRDEGRLRVRRQVQLLLRTLPAQPGEREAESLVGLFKGLPRRGAGLGPDPAHPHLLRALAGKDEGDLLVGEAHQASAPRRPLRCRSSWLRSSAILSRILRSSLALENSIARRMAFWTARAFERPWPMKQPPLIPSRGAAPYSV